MRLCDPVKNTAADGPFTIALLSLRFFFIKIKF